MTDLFSIEFVRKLAAQEVSTKLLIRIARVKSFAAKRYDKLRAIHLTKIAQS